jgi:hypothetical protein
VRHKHESVRAYLLGAMCRELGPRGRLPSEREVAERLGIPFESVTQAALLPLAYYTGQAFRPAERLPVDHLLHWEAWSPASAG